METDITLNKRSIIEKCLKRIREEFQNEPANLMNISKQDAIVLNLQRACEATIDLAMHVVAVRKLGIPQQSRDAFQMLLEAKLLPAELAERLKKMVGFRNIAIHDYQALNVSILKEILTAHLSDFEKFLLVLSKFP